MQDQNIVILQGDKESSVVIMDKSYPKLEDMIEQGISKGIYVKMDDTTLQDLKRFQDFLHRNFYNYKNYHKMYRHSKQPAKLYRIAKTHKFKDINEITKKTN